MATTTRRTSTRSRSPRSSSASARARRRLGAPRVQMVVVRTREQLAVDDDRRGEDPPRHLRAALPQLGAGARVEGMYVAGREAVAVVDDAVGDRRGGGDAVVGPGGRLPGQLQLALRVER